MRGQVLLAAAFAASSLMAAQPAAARDYPSYHDTYVAQAQQCQQQQTGNTMAGAILGGLAGAILGSQMSADHHRSDGAVLGAAAGAALGGAIGNSATRNSQVCRPPQQGAYDPYYGQPPQDQYQGRDPYDDGSGLEGGPYQQPSGYHDDRGGRDCRWGERLTRDRSGYDRRESVYMCRGDDGVWRRASR